MNFLYLLLLIVLLIIILEFSFLLIYRIKKKINYKFVHKLNPNKVIVESHPYLPFVYKKKGIIDGGLISYPLNLKTKIPNLELNSLRFANGDNGNREVIVPKPKDLFRINCLGASTTGNYIEENNINYSYPLILERMLKMKNKNIEVNNCAQGGYNSLDILIRFQTQILDTNPDLIILYHGYNDIRSYLTNNFSSDYYHSRKSFSENKLQLKLNNLIPNPKLNFLNYFRNKLFDSDLRSSLLDMIAKGDIKINNDFREGLKTYKRNLSIILDICSAKKIDVILSTFCFYLYDDIKNNDLHLKYQEIVDEENEIIKQLAKEYNLMLIDMFNLIPKEKDFFLDTIHFTKKGMQLVATEFYNEIKKKI